MKLVNVKIGGKGFRVKNCAGLGSVRGLMFDSMAGYDGALIYANNIWMPFVRRKLNLIFLDKDMRVTSSALAEPMTFRPESWKTYEDESAEYCLELKDTKLKVKKGVKVSLGE
jgi:uncharacterized membrane protein (UPF0127 family)